MRLGIALENGEVLRRLSGASLSPSIGRSIDSDFEFIAADLQLLAVDNARRLHFATIDGQRRTFRDPPYRNASAIDVDVGMDLGEIRIRQNQVAIASRTD